jgi:RecA/RadA recombinase
MGIGGYMNKSDKMAKLKLLAKEINKTNKSTVLKFASDEKDWERIPTGCEAINKITGGGFPKGHLSVVWGGSGTSKSSLAYTLVAEAQKMGLVCAYIDLECSYDATRAEEFGVNSDELFLGNFDQAERAMNAMRDMAKEGVVDVIILDSIQSLSSKGDQETKSGKKKSLEDETMALLARKLSKFFPMIIPSIHKNNILMLAIGQTRTDLGGFIALQKLSGGNALVHNSVLTINLRNGAKADAPKEKQTIFDPDGKEHKRAVAIGFDVVAKINKTQTSGTKPEQTEIHYPFYYDGGFIKKDKSEEINLKEGEVSEVKKESAKTKRRGRPKKSKEK